MKKTTPIAALLAVALGSVAFAHGGVQNKAVLARMESMSTIGDAMKVLGQMVKGQTAFDAGAARAAARTIAEASAQVPALFETAETDPKSESLPAIWDNWADFAAKSEDLTRVATALSTSIAGPGDLPAAMGQLGGACKACHQPYRAKR